MKTRALLIASLAAFALTTGAARADVWDQGADNDDSPGTDNQLVHGSVQVHDLAARPGPVADQDWFYVSLAPYTSFEVQLDGQTGMLGAAGISLERYAQDGTTLQQTAVPAGDWVLRLNWANNTANRVGYYLKVGNAFCGTTCTTNDQYTIRAKETTVMVARFNNSGTQTTVLMSQNASDVPVDANYFYWNASGTLLQQGSLTGFGPKSLNVFQISNFPALQGVAGHITITHNAPYGTWNVKAVALEPATGFSFDTPGVIRP